MSENQKASLLSKNEQGPHVSYESNRHDTSAILRACTGNQRQLTEPQMTSSHVLLIYDVTASTLKPSVAETGQQIERKAFVIMCQDKRSHYVLICNCVKCRPIFKTVTGIYGSI